MCLDKFFGIKYESGDILYLMLLCRTNLVDIETEESHNKMVHFFKYLDVACLLCKMIKGNLLSCWPNL